MKKIFTFSILLLVVACGACIRNQNGSENLIRLGEAPKQCEFLYKITSQASVYKEEDAYRYLENNIMEQKNIGNAYIIISKDKKNNTGAIIGPEYSYVLTADIYNCLNVKDIHNLKI